MTLRPIKLGSNDLPDGSQVEVFVDIDDAILDTWLSGQLGACFGTWPLLPLTHGALTLRVVDRTGEPKRQTRVHDLGIELGDIPEGLFIGEIRFGKTTEPYPTQPEPPDHGVAD